MRGIIGADKVLSGEIFLENKKIVNRDPGDAEKNGIVMVPEDRKTQGILANLGVGKISPSVHCTGILPHWVL